MAHIVIADSHTLCREALCSFIRNADRSMTVSGAGDYKSLREIVSRERADLVIIEDAMIDNKFTAEDMNGAKLGILFAKPGEQEAPVSDVQGIFNKGISCKSFYNGIQKILSGQDYASADEPEQIVQPVEWGRAPQDFSLTMREKEVLSHLVRGESNKDIARALKLQVVTVKLHVRGICRKMKVSNRTQAALLAKENGWA